MRFPLSTSRRTFLEQASGGFGLLALAGMLCNEAAAANDPLAARAGHFPAKADRVIFIYSTGGVSHIDTFIWSGSAAMNECMTSARWE